MKNYNIFHMMNSNEARLLMRKDAYMVRMALINENSLLSCKQEGLWAEKRNLMKKWDLGDVLLLKIENMLVGYGIVIGKAFTSDLMYWENDVYPFRIDMKWALLSNESRIEVDEIIRSMLIKNWGDRYGLGILLHWPLNDEVGQNLVEMIDKRM